MSVRLRRRRLPNGRTRLYLSINASGQRKYEALNMFLTHDRVQNKETVRLAEAIRAKRELDLHADQHGVAAPWKRRVNVFDYAEGLLQQKTTLTKRTYVNALDYLKLLRGDQLTFADVSERLCEDFRDFLLSKVKRNTAASYFARFKTVIRHAVREGYLQRDPALDLTVHTVETMPRYLNTIRFKSSWQCPAVMILSAMHFCFRSIPVCGFRMYVT
jgi:hypothetical protein